MTPRRRRCLKLTPLMDIVLGDMMFHDTPFFVHPNMPRLWIKAEGAGTYPAHKHRSAAWLVRHAVLSGVDPRRCADRSSSSWAMGLAKAVYVVGGESTFVTVGEPPPMVKAIVEAHNGRFVKVATNAERIAALETLKLQGFWVPDQHRNLNLVQAFAETLGAQLARDIAARGLAPRFLIGARGTGASLAGAGRALGPAGSLTLVAAEVSSAFTGAGARAWKHDHVKVRGVGSDDELCDVYRHVRDEIHDEHSKSALEAAEAMLAFTRCSIGSGMSGGLVLATAADVLRRHPEGDAVAILADSPLLYPDELAAATRLHQGDLP